MVFIPRNESGITRISHSQVGADIGLSKVAFDGGAVSSNAGTLLLRQAAETGKFFDQVAACLSGPPGPEPR